MNHFSCPQYESSHLLTFYCFLHNVTYIFIVSYTVKQIFFLLYCFLFAAFLGLSNSPLEYPFQKALKGKDMFGQIVTKYPTTVGKEHLIKDLINLMSDRTS